MPEANTQPGRPETFDLARSPLEGFNLIDASAGTGKTYTICSLVLRLLLEKKLPVEQILVVTYTEAATEDLRGRIRQKLRQAIDALENLQCDDEFLRNYLPSVKDHQEAARLLSNGLRGFDEAAIHTIHGFCQRMLLENSFESNSLFDTELITDDSQLTREIVEDFWRRVLAGSSDLFCAYAAEAIAPDTLLDFLRPFLPHPFLRIIPELSVSESCYDLPGREQDYIEAYRDVCREWPKARNLVCQDLLYSPALNRNTYNKTSVEKIIRSMDDMAAADLPGLNLFEKFSLLTSSRIAGAIKKGQTIEIIPFYKLCDTLVLAQNNLAAEFDQCLLALRKKLLESFRPELNIRKLRDNVFSFDDLLRRLYEALRGPAGTSLARLIKEKYPAALIDEFQDTDPLQFKIFQAIYPQKSLLFLIGDPKQAIYSFRGADIFTYMDAATISPMAHHTLGVNHRSCPGLVQAVNTIFARTHQPFVFDAISFQPVSAAQKKDPEHLTFDGRQAEPLILWYVDGTAAPGNNDTRNKTPRLTKSAAKEMIISRVAAEICRLLSLSAENRALINSRKLMPGDIAILVRTNDEARKMQQALHSIRVSSVLHSGDDLFRSNEAREMASMLDAMISPADIRRVKTGLITCFFGIQANSIILQEGAGPENKTGIEHWLTKCKTYHELWNRFGFIRMFWTVMRENRVRQRLLAAENGERSLTNILHLAEILNQEEVKHGLNMSTLLGYLQERMAGDLGRNIEHQLRLESDEDRVKIVTIHKAKGLEYPVVFCPFTWEGSRLNDNNGCLFHEKTGNGRTELVFDAGSPELQNHIQAARVEEMAENIRLFYVALTRAVHRCYLFWGNINTVETSAPAYLLHHSAGNAMHALISGHKNFGLLQNAADRFSDLSGPEILADLNDLAADSEGTISIWTGQAVPEASLLQEMNDQEPLQFRKFTGTIRRDWRISSFSSLTAGKYGDDEYEKMFQDRTADRDAVPLLQSTSATQPIPDAGSYNIFSFPHGPRSGILLHELLELADFSKESPLADDLIKEKLLYFGYDQDWYPVIGQLLTDIARVRLHDDIPGLTLSSIPRTDCLHELEFYFPVSSLSVDNLKQTFRSKLPDEVSKNAALLDHQLDRLTFAPSRGFMRGFIDLIFQHGNKFYLLDWKSNFLGPAPENYHRDKLAETMVSGFYFLQYHIYSLALHLYLKKRDEDYRYNEHFGGVFYIFLRGVNKDRGPDYGIYHELPELSALEMLGTQFLGQ